MATCSKCGKLNYEGVKYCTACGTPLSDSGGNYNQGNNDYEEDQDQEEEEQEVAPPASQEQREPKKGFDRRILFIILGVLLLIGLIFLLRSLFSGGDMQVRFKISPESVYPGTEVTLEDLTEGANSWDWNFGDDSNEEGMDKIVHHTYQEPGEYMVVLTINGKYTDSLKVIVINNLPTPVEEDADVIISGPTEVVVGEPVQFTDNTPGATSWQWMFGETGRIDDEHQTATYTFQNVNRDAVVTVRNNITKKSGEIHVNVKRKTATTAAATTTATQPATTPTKPSGGGSNMGSGTPAMAKLKYTEKQVQEIFQKYINSSNNSYPDFVAIKDGNAGGDGSIPVVKNGGKPKDLKAFMTSLSFENAGTKVEGVKFTKDKDGLVTKIEVTVK